MTSLYRAVTAFLYLKLVNLSVNLFRFPVLRDAPARPRIEPTVSLLIPVRDEVDRLDATLSGLLAQDVEEVLFLDDESGDGSAQLLQQACRDYARAGVLTGVPRPDGWTGKTWALSQLAERASGEVLVFCDADVLLAEGAVDAVLGEMRRQRADAFSVFPRQRTGTLGERLLVPLIDDVLLCFLPFPLLNAPVPSAATANGSVFAFDRACLQALGGFASVRTAVVEDVAMAKLVRRNGFRLGLALGGELIQTRMYNRYADVVTGFGRGLGPAVGGSRTTLLTGLGWHLLVYSLPPLMIARGHWRWVAPVVLAVLERSLVEAKTGRRQWWESTTVALSPLAAVPVVARALRREQTWKGRTYR